MSEDVRVRTGQSCLPDAAAAVREFHAAVAQPDMALVGFFCSSNYDLAVIAAEMNRLFPGVAVIGCTSAGEIGPAGYRANSLSGFSLPGGACMALAERVDNLSDFDTTAGLDRARDLASRLGAAADGLDHRFGFLLIDGLSVREEAVAQAFQAGLGLIPLFGGSAGDDMQFKRTLVFHEGAFHPNAAVLALVATRFPLKTFKTQHFVCDDERLVVTEADPVNRIVKEINGLPAVEEYARLIGKSVDGLAPAAFASAPVVVVIDGTDYVRSIQKANPDGSLTFYSAIEEGLVLRIAHGIELVDNLKQAFADLRAEIGPPQLIIACDCILRNLEATDHRQKEEVGDIFRANRAVGFSTYGEQFHGVHVNQTLTGVAIGTGVSDA
jgi:hypothetical protein